MMEPADLHRRIRSAAAETPYWLQAAGVPGMSVALLEGGKTRDVLCFGSTDAQGKVPVTEATIFQAASLTKQALLYAALKTVEAGKLDLDRPLASYVEAPFEANDPDVGRITGRHVLSHTTGWPNWPPKGQPIKRARPIGGEWGYSGQGFLYLQTALEGIWKEPARAYLQRLVLDPLGMRESSFIWREGYAKTATRGFDPGGNAPEPWQPSEVNGAASLHTTAREYASLLQAFLDRDLRRRHSGVFSSQVAIDARIGWSLGWGTAGKSLWQWGDNGTFKAFTALEPSRGLGIVVLTNGLLGQRLSREWVNAWLGTDHPAFHFRWVAM